MKGMTDVFDVSDLSDVSEVSFYNFLSFGHAQDKSFECAPDKWFA
jgi:hypothetical protein